MAGVDPNAGESVETMQVPSIDMDDTGPTAPIVKSEHMNDNRAEGVSYNENPGVDVDGQGSGFPAGTDVGEANNPLKP